MTEQYINYFNIDPDYFPAVNEEVIEQNPDIWKKFYPHETFVKLLKDTISVLTRKNKQSIWVEGAYGTGKSHAVLTLKKLLDASEQDVDEYFEKYPEQLPKDIYNNFKNVKNDSKKIITVHRYGSSNILNDNDLAFSIQESIRKALEENGIDNLGNKALKDTAIEWLSKPRNKAYMNSLISEEYSEEFNGDDVDAIIHKLKNFEPDELSDIMRKISKVGKAEHFDALALDCDGLDTWIRDVIRENNLKAIVFIWDEFTNYFMKNINSLTGFQKIIEISETDPFYMIIVTHKSEALFNDADKDKKAIFDRFVSPRCNITLPENMAFRLMGAAMVKKKDTEEEWNEIVSDLYNRTEEARELVKKQAKISDTELKGILPIHPYAALLMKYISSVFDSNQRSMFDFIKNDHGDEIKGFQWFINNYGPFSSANPLLSVDMLWDFFYEKGKQNLSQDVRSILDCYSLAKIRNLSEDEECILKTVLLLQAISQHVDDSVEMFIPNEKNLNYAFEGTNLNGVARGIAEKLCREDILYRRPMGNNKYHYAAMINVGDIGEIDKLKDEIRKKKTVELINQGELESAFSMTGALALRYKFEVVAVSNLTAKAKEIRNKFNDEKPVIPAIAAVAKNDDEAAAIRNTIKELTSDISYSNIVFIDAGAEPLGYDAFEQYVDAMSNARYQQGKDNKLADKYVKNASEILHTWRHDIEEGAFYVSYIKAGELCSERIVSSEGLHEMLMKITKFRFPLCLESGKKVIDNMWSSANLALGVECGIKEETRSTFKNKNLSLEDYIGREAWGLPEEDKKYWERKPNILISKIKHNVMKTIEEGFAKSGRAAITEIYNNLTQAPFGFLTCNLSAFVLGFVLKEYADGSYSCTDGLKTEELTEDKLKEIVGEAMKLQTTPNNRYREKYIVRLKDEQKAFNEASAEIFKIPLNQCTDIEKTRELIRNSMKKFSFPIWCIKNAIGNQGDSEKLKKLIDLYSGIANNNNISGLASDNDIAIEIGGICKNNNLAQRLGSLFVPEKFAEGMTNYLNEFEGGIMIKLADELGDNGKFINVLKSKFDADEANWVWNIETANKKIEEVILEYRIILESNSVNTKAITLKDSIKGWREKCNNIKIAFSAMKNSIDEIGLKELLEVLHNIAKQGKISNSQKENFYKLLRDNKNSFVEFYSNQEQMFRKIFVNYINKYDFNDEEVNEIYENIPKNCFLNEGTSYSDMVVQSMSKYSFNRRTVKLNTLWKEKTGTNSPKEWSDRYSIPILYMLDEEEIQLAKSVFDVINNGSKTANSELVEEAIEYLSNAKFFDKLSNPEEREDVFNKAIIKKYSTILDDVNEVQGYLRSNIKGSVYDWYGSPSVERKVMEKAKNQYRQTGAKKAIEKIDCMDAAAVKKYLKELIHDNLEVGIEILSDN